MPAGRKPLIAISATFTAEPIHDSLAFWLRKMNLTFDLQFAPYNQVFQELITEGSLLRSNSDGVNVLLVRLEDWQGDAGGSQLDQSGRELVGAVRAAAAHSAVPYVVCMCPSSPATLANGSKSSQLARVEEEIATGLKEVPGVYLVTTSELARLYPVRDYYSAHTDEIGHVPYTADFFTALGTLVVRRTWALRSRPYKVVVLDCDGTLWQGTCGEEGADGVAFGAPFKALQEFMVRQHDAGMLLCVCSKNSEEDVFAVFDRRRDQMALKREHFVAWRVNWTAKSENIKSLAADLELGLDSFIMVDDNPIECAEISANCPEVLTLQLPPDPARFPTFLSRVWAFDHLRVTSEDKTRTELYRANIQRESAREGALTMEDFLRGLQLQIDVAPADTEQLERVAQLTQRTNQFNVSGLRRTHAELQRLCERGERQCLVVQVKDRFGDYGLVGAAIYASTPEAVVVDSLLLSCRALGRRVEHRMLSELGRMARQLGASRVDVPFVPSPKNKPAADFLESVGGRFKDLSEGAIRFRFPTEIAAGL